ncbi:Multifunctional non-homologous end joining protein LigD [Paenibacillus sp. CECT 9249]|uniref:ATP-dependent DNA ligase n=1 Tax=Paenibacillus sp. CECT 9249 TaxID=2845385 RepID=UPI001E365578|nr:RNA ligase family protein [Paenibacillus sp. CECT 9249]CAH0119398.1 Multifunctional non-homologous end joining protein LigD [Paenibacillus sp. CECT 9249]
MNCPPEPMAPISSDRIPEGDDWVYQLKWDGVRMLAHVDHGRVELYSRKRLNKTAVYPEVVQQLAPLQGHYWLDGEVVYFDPELGRPNFQKVLQRERMRGVSLNAAAATPIAYVLFDILMIRNEDLRGLPYSERHRRLASLFPEAKPQLFVTDQFQDGHALWAWIESRQWEGIVSKRLSSTYHEGKNHQDWFKKKTKLLLVPDIVGVKRNEGRVASLVMRSENGGYIGKVSLGLTTATRQWLEDYAESHPRGRPAFHPLPADLAKEEIRWIDEDHILKCEVTGLEFTGDGLLRHPKIVKLHMK